MSVPEYAAEPAEPKEPLSEREILAVLQAEMNAANGATLSSVLSDRRARAIDDYLGAKYGNEREGRSAVVMRDVFETVEWILPDLLETFTAGNTLARFSPKGPEDEAESEQQTDLTNHIFLVENEGFNTLHHWFKDALLQQGIVKWWWEESQRVETETYERMTAEQIALLGMAPDLEIVAATPLDQEGIAYDVMVRRTHSDGRVMVQPIPGEEFLIDRDARSIKEARFVAHMPLDMTASKLRELGYSQEVVDSLQSYPSTENDAETIARRQLEDDPADSRARDTRSDSERQVCYVEALVKIDIDRDGISELMKVCAAGQGSNLYQILYMEPALEINFASLSPILIPHRFNGLGVAECISDLQEIHTAIARTLLDGFYLANYPRHKVLRGPSGMPLVNIDQLLTVVPGSQVEVDRMDAVEPLPTIDPTANALVAMDWARQTREERTGVNRYTQGMEAPELNTTATGLVALQGAANKRIKFIARIFAETGVKDLMRGIAGLLKRHQRVAKTIRLRGEWTPIDPSTWKNDYDCSIEVGLGYGDKTEQVSNNQTILALQEKAAVLAPNLVSPEGAFEAIKELLKTMGYRNAERFFQDPAKHPMPPPEPSIDEKKLMLETAKTASDKEIKLRELDLEEMRIRFDHEIELMKLGAKMAESKAAESVAVQ